MLIIHLTVKKIPSVLESIILERKRAGQEAKCINMNDIDVTRGMQCVVW